MAQLPPGPAPADRTRRGAVSGPKAASASSQRLKEPDQRRALLRRGIDHGLFRRLGLAAVPEDRLGEIPRPAIMKEEGVAVYRLGQSDTPKRRCPPFAPRGVAERPAVGEPL